MKNWTNLKRKIKIHQKNANDKTYACMCTFTYSVGAHTHICINVFTGLLLSGECKLLGNVKNIFAQEIKMQNERSTK